MPVDHIRYDILVQEALRGMVRERAGRSGQKQGQPGEQSFFLTFDTTAKTCGCHPRLLAQYPQEMTVVLQHQFWDLKVTDEAFEVGLSFGGVAERLFVPFDAIKAFADPSVQFTLQFESLAEMRTRTLTRPKPKRTNASARAPEPQRQEPGGPVFRQAPYRRRPHPRGRRIRTSRRTKAAPKWCGSTASARSDGQSCHHKTDQGSQQDRERQLRPDRGAG